jgi:hypothetical protein
MADSRDGGAMTADDGATTAGDAMAQWHGVDGQRRQRDDAVAQRRCSAAAAAMAATASDGHDSSATVTEARQRQTAVKAATVQWRSSAVKVLVRGGARQPRLRRRRTAATYSEFRAREQQTSIGEV